MDFLDYLSQFPTSDMNETTIISQKEHEELFMQIQDFIENQVYSIQATLERLLSAYEPLLVLKQTALHNSEQITRVRCRTYYVLLFFCLTSLRVYPNFFHPTDTTELQLAKFINKNKKIESQQVETVGPQILTKMCSIAFNCMKFIITAHNDPTNSSSQLYGQGSISQYIFSQHKQGIIACSYNINEVFESHLRILLHLVLDVLSNIRSKYHLQLVLIFYFEILDMINKQQIEDIESRQITEFQIKQKGENKLRYQKLVIVAGGILNSIGSMFAAGMATFIHQLSEKKSSQADPQEQVILKSHIVDFSQYFIKIVVSYISKNRNFDYLDQACEEISKLSFKNLENKESVPKLTSDPLIIAQSETYYYLICCMLIPFKTMLTSFTNLYQQTGTYFKYQYYVNLCTQFKNGIFYAGQAFNYSPGELQNIQGNIFSYKELFVSLTIGYDDIVKTEDTSASQMHPMMLLIQALQLQSSIVPDNLVSCLCNDNYIYDVSEYLAKYLQTNQSNQNVDFIKKYLDQISRSRELIPHQKNEIVGYITAFRALLLASQYISSDRSLINYIATSQLQFNLLQYYYQIERNSYFPSIQFARIPRNEELLTLKPLQDNLPEDRSYNQDFGSDPLPKELTEDKRDLIFTEKVSNIIFALLSSGAVLQKVLKLCGKNQLSNFLLEGLLDLFIVCGQNKKVQIKYVDHCSLLNVIVKCAINQSMLINLLQKFITFSEQSKLVILDCLGSFFLNRKPGYSIISTELLGVEDCEEQSENVNFDQDDIQQKFLDDISFAKIFEQEAVQQFLQSEGDDASLAELFKQDIGNIFGGQFIASLTKTRPQTPFMFMRTNNDIEIVENLRILCQMLVMSYHDVDVQAAAKTINSQKIKKQAQTQAQVGDAQADLTIQQEKNELEADVGVLKAVLSAGWFSAFLLDETDVLKSETGLLQYFTKILRNLIQEQQELLISKFQPQFKIFDKFQLFKSCLFLILKRSDNLIINKEICELFICYRRGNSVVETVNKPQNHDFYIGQTQSNQFVPNVPYLLQNAMGCIINEILSNLYCFSKKVVLFQDFQREEVQMHLETTKIDKQQSDIIENLNCLNCQRHALEEFQFMNQLPKIQSQLTQVQYDIILTQAVLLAGLGIAKLESLTANKLEFLHNFYTEKLEDQDKQVQQLSLHSDVQLMVQAIIFYEQVCCEEFKVVQPDKSITNVILQQFLSLFYQLLEIFINPQWQKQNLMTSASILNPPRFNIICHFLFLGLSRFLASQLNSLEDFVCSFQDITIDLFDQIVQISSYFYESINDNEVKQSLLIMLKQLFLKLPCKEGIFSPYKLEFILNIHNYCSFSDSQLQKILISTRIERCDAIKLVQYIVNKQGQQQLCKSFLEASFLQRKIEKHSFQHRINRLVLPQSLVFMLRFHPQFESISDQLEPKYVAISVNQCMDFEMIGFLKQLAEIFPVIVAQKQQFGYTLEDQFSAELFVCFYKAVEFIFTKYDLLEQKTAYTFIETVGQYISQSDLIWVAQNQNGKFDNQSVSFQLLQQLVMAVRTGGSYAMQLQLQNMGQLSTLVGLQLGQIIARFFVKMASSKPSQCAIQTYALKQLDKTGFLALQALFLGNPIQYLQDFADKLFANALNAVALLLPITVKTYNQEPVFVSCLFRNQLSFSQQFNGFLFEIAPNAASKKEKKSDESSDDTPQSKLAAKFRNPLASFQDFGNEKLNPQDFQRYQTLLHFVKEEKQSPKSQELFAKVVEYKSNIGILGIAGFSAVLLAVIAEADVVQPIERKFTASFLNTDVQKAEEAEICEETCRVETGCLMKGIVTLIRAIFDFHGYCFSSQQLYQMLRPSASGVDSVRYLVCRLVFWTNQKHFYDNDFFQLISYRQDEITANKFNVTTRSKKKNSFHNHFSTVLNKVFPKFWSQTTINYCHSLIQFVKTFITGQGGSQNFKFGTSTKFQETELKQLSDIHSSAFGTVNQLSRRYQFLLKQFFTEHLHIRLVDSDYPLVPCLATGEPVFNCVNRQLLQFVNAFIGQLIYPEELRQMKPSAPKLLKVQYQPTIKCFENLMCIHHVLLSNFKLENQESQAVYLIKSMDVFCTLFGSETSDEKVKISTQIADILTTTAVLAPIPEVVAKAANQLLLMYQQGVLVRCQSLLLVAVLLFVNGDVQASREHILFLKANHLHCLVQQKEQSAEEQQFLFRISQEYLAGLNNDQYQQTVLLRLADHHKVPAATKALLQFKKNELKEGVLIEENYASMTEIARIELVNQENFD